MIHHSHGKIAETEWRFDLLMRVPQWFALWFFVHLYFIQVAVLHVVLRCIPTVYARVCCCCCCCIAGCCSSTCVG